VIVRFVDIGGIVDHHCLTFLCIVGSFTKSADGPRVSSAASVSTLT
jgi:hypothetical protein